MNALDMLRQLARQGRPALEGFVESAITLLDAIDGDPDVEDATDAEDDFSLSTRAMRYGADGPGCSISDDDAEAAAPTWQIAHAQHSLEQMGVSIVVGSLATHELRRELV